jgi:alanine racemase
VTLPETEYSGSEATINLNTLSKNLELLKQKSGKERVIAVVKANAYGHGAVSISKFLEDKVSHLAVASVDEGIQLRQAGIELPILVFGVLSRGNAAAYKRFRLTATVSHPGHFDLLPAGTGYHLNFDTGMRRVGLFPAQLEEVLQAVQKHKDLECRGIYSHYATADDPGSEYVRTQHELFKQIRAQFPPEIPAHMSNTAAILHYDVGHFDLIRVGIGLFGYAPGKIQPEGLIPALNWQTSAVMIRKINEGDRVSYGGTWKAPHAGYLATLPVGYADGIPRALSNRLHVKIGNEMYPVVGNVTMDYCMVFLGDKRIKSGSAVHLMGSQGWPANTWAEQANSITHEILCRLTPRVRRRYQSV